MFVDRGHQVAKRHANPGHHVALVGARVIGTQLCRTGVLDSGFGIEVGGAEADFVVLEPGHAGGVAIHRAGIVGRRGPAGKTGTHTADTLFVESKTTGKQLRGNKGNGQRQRAFEQFFIHY